MIDGDTVDVLVDLGFNAYQYITLRLADINAHEIFRGTEQEREKGRMAKAFLESLVLEKPVIVRTFKDRTSFGRYVGLLYTLKPDGTFEENVNRQMLKAGHAVATNN